MRCLSILFCMMLLVALAWTCGGTALMTVGVQQAHTTADPHLSAQDNQAVDFLSKGMVGSMGVSFFLCTGIPASLVLFLLAFITNSADIAERRHRELLAAQMIRNDALGNMATFQAAQAQMQFTQMQNQQRPVTGKFPDEIERESQSDWLKRHNKERQSKLDKYR